MIRHQKNLLRLRWVTNTFAKFTSLNSHLLGIPYASRAALAYCVYLDIYLRTSCQCRYPTQLDAPRKQTNHIKSFMQGNNNTQTAVKTNASIFSVAGVYGSVHVQSVIHVLWDRLFLSDWGIVVSCDMNVKKK